MFRKLSRIKQQIPEDECLGILKQEVRGVLSVQGDDGYPYGLPTNHYYCEEDGRIYFHSGPKGHKVDAIRNCDKASFCVMDEGYRKEGDWALSFRSVIVFGRIEIVDDLDKVIDICRRLSYRFTQDEAFIEDSVKNEAARTLLFALIPENITGKRVREA